MDEFANQFIAQLEVTDSFNQYKDSYAKERDIAFPIKVEYWCRY